MLFSNIFAKNLTKYKNGIKLNLHWNIWENEPKSCKDDGLIIPII